LSYRRSLSFAEHEEVLVNYYDNNGKSDFAKEAMKFYLRYKDRITILPENVFINSNQQIQNKDTILENKIKKLIKR
jgi:hypothetical protein